MSDRMSLAEARLYVEPGPVENNMQRSARTIVACGDMLDKIREECPQMTREQYVFGDPVDREVNNTVHEILGRIEDALGVEK